MAIDFLLNSFNQERQQPALIWRDTSVTYGWLYDAVASFRQQFAQHGIGQGTVTVLEGDFSPRAVALFLALIAESTIIVPLTRSVAGERPLGALELAQVQRLIAVDKQEEVHYTELSHVPNHPLYHALWDRQHPGLILFTSGSSGEPKAAVHDFHGLLQKFKQKRPPARMINFLRFDHWGGLNTLLHILSTGGTVVTVPDRTPDTVCSAIAHHHVEVLPTSPTFLNLLLLSEAYQRYDLSSLRLITYGTEPMPLSTLRRLQQVFPNVRLQQTYGLIELGVMRSKSREDGSLWVKVGGEGFETRVVDGILQIKAESAMLGYLNAPSPFTDDGWFITGDAVEVDGEYIRILGRVSEIINVGGEKVYPAEVESVIQEMDNVAEVTVYGESNPFTGKMVCARLRLVNDEDPRAFTMRLKQFCRQRMQSYKIPVKVEITKEALVTDRMKRLRVKD